MREYIQKSSLLLVLSSGIVCMLALLIIYQFFIYYKFEQIRKNHDCYNSETEVIAIISKHTKLKDSEFFALKESFLKNLNSSKETAHIYNVKYMTRFLGLLLVFGIGIIIAFVIIEKLLNRNLLLKSQFNEIKKNNKYAEELSLAAAGLAHETKNPLGIVRGLAQQITNDTIDIKKTKSKAYDIMEQVDITTARLGDFMSYAKIRQPNLISVNPNKIITKITGLLLSDFDTANVDLTVQVDNVKILADEEMFSQILLNLISNSLNFTKRGGSVIVKLEENWKNRASLSIIDTGLGITTHVVSDIFKPYVSKSLGGHGIGLAIVKRIIDLSNWDVKVKSEINVGTEIKISNIVVVGKGEF